MYKTLFKNGINYLHLNRLSRRISEFWTTNSIIQLSLWWSWSWSYGTPENVGKFFFGFSSMFFEMDWFFHKPLYWYLVRCYVSFSLGGLTFIPGTRIRRPSPLTFFSATSWQVPINIFCGEDQLQQAKIWEVVRGQIPQNRACTLKIVSLIGNCKPTQ